jgi:phosphoribosylanthranilate isomerase
MRVKVCGITRLEDLELCGRLGVHAVGFNFYPGSSRYITPEEVRKALPSLAPFLYRVGVFVNEPDVDKVKWIAVQLGLHALQFHGDESPDYCSQFDPYPVIKAFRAGKDFRLAGLNAFKVSSLLLDGYQEGKYGGTGVISDWQLAAEIAHCWPVVLSGGLDPDNVRAAVKQVQPMAVDVCSGVESAPGIKDPVKLSRFMEALQGL